MEEQMKIKEVLLEDDVILTPIPELLEHGDETAYQNYFADCANGRIWSNVSQKYLTTKGNNRFGYVYNSIKGKPYSLHSLIISSTLGVSCKWYLEQGLEVDHIDGDKENNDMDNLRLVSRKQQYNERVRQLLGKGKRFTEADVLFIIEKYEEHSQEDSFKLSTFINEMADSFEKTYTSVENLLKGKSYKDLTGDLKLVK